MASGNGMVAHNSNNSNKPSCIPKYGYSGDILWSYNEIISGLFDGSKRTLHRDVMGYTVSYKPNVDCWVYIYIYIYNEDTMGYHSGLGPMIW